MPVVAKLPFQAQKSRGTARYRTGSLPRVSEGEARLAASSDNGKAASASAGAKGRTSPAGSLVDQLKQEHQHLAAAIGEAKFDLEQVARSWARHVAIEETVLTPALREAGVEAGSLVEFAARRDMVRVLFRHLMDEPNAASLRDLLRQEIGELAAAEERKDTGLHGLGEARQIDMTALADRASERSRQFDANADVDIRHALEPTHFRSTGSRQRQDEETSMPDYNRDRDERGRFRSDDDGRRYASDDRNRDERGRFTDDDRGYRSRDDDDRRRGYDDDRRYSTSRYDDDRSRYAGNDRNRDERGRFTDDDRGYRSRDDDDRRSGYDDDRRYASSRYDDDRRSSDEGRGWHGDPQGHSEASRRGWENRDDRYARSDRDDDGRHSRSSRRDDDDRDRGHGGWFGDPRGHSEAARRGWEDRR